MHCLAELRLRIKAAARARLRDTHRRVAALLRWFGWFQGHEFSLHSVGIAESVGFPLLLRTLGQRLKKSE
jgi:hypothetical protein